MRIWHKDFITVLPARLLLTQWKDCCTVKSTSGVTAKKIETYPEWHLVNYTARVYQEIMRRGYEVDRHDFEWKECESDGDELFAGWHNRRYLKQCYYNLQEKYDCGIISNTEWVLIDSRYRRLMNES